MTDHTDRILSELEVLMSGEKAKRDTWRSQAYRKAIEAVQNFGYPIECVDDVSGVKNIGAKIMNKIGEIITNGSTKKGDTFRSDPTIQLVTMLTKINGVGPVAAHKLIKNGIKSLNDLLSRSKELLTERQQLGLKHYHDTIKKIPRSEMEMHERYILSQVDGIDITAVVAGSYRRGKGESGDIDVLVRDNLCGGPQVYQDLIKRLRASNYLVDDIVYGENKYNGYCRHPDLLDNRRIDIMYTKPEEYAFALFYFTGSGDFNQELRGQLSKLGYRLNEHGIKKLVGDTWEPVAIPCTGKVPTEKDIFKFLGIPYIAPQYRSRESLLKVSKGGTMLIPQRKSEPLVPNSVVRSGSKLTTSMEGTHKPKRLKISPPSSPKPKPKRLKISGGSKPKTKLQSLAPDSMLDIGQTTQIDGHTIKKL